MALYGRLFSFNKAKVLEDFCGRNEYRIVTSFAPVEKLWGYRPARPMEKAFIHTEKYSGESATSKIARLMEKVGAYGADGMFISALDDIAWLFNLRGADVPFNPVVIAFAYVSEDENVLFVDTAKLNVSAEEYLRDAAVKVKPYDKVMKYLEDIPRMSTVLLDPNVVSDTLGRAIEADKVYAKSPISLLKAIKNETQIEGTRKAMERDGAAMVKLFAWIEKNVATGTIKETDVWEKGKAFRAEGELYKGDSFGMICGYKEHGAIVHYHATEGCASTLQGEGMLLVDSGGQYLDGTTDITRTITLGNPTDEEKHDYTLVLKGHLAIGRAIYPIGTRGSQLDALARIYQWQEGMTYLHGTGHGVGHFLCVHEGPQNIRMNENPATLEVGMITSNEPGLYKAGKYGIRTENLVLTVPAMESEEFGKFLKFETLTLFPYDRKLMDVSMLSEEELTQVNDYHAEVKARLTSYLQGEELAWLEANTKEITR